MATSKSVAGTIATDVADEITGDGEGGGPGVGVGVDNLLLETGDNLLLETGDVLLLE